jgi:hypothetical protein
MELPGNVKKTSRERHAAPQKGNSSVGGTLPTLGKVAGRIRVYGCSGTAMPSPNLPHPPTLSLQEGKKGREGQRRQAYWLMPLTNRRWACCPKKIRDPADATEPVTACQVSKVVQRGE